MAQIARALLVGIAMAPARSDRAKIRQYGHSPADLIELWREPDDPWQEDGTMADDRQPEGWFDSGPDAGAAAAAISAGSATYLEAIRAALEDELAEDERVVLIGEDIGVMGGAFRVTEG